MLKGYAGRRVHVDLSKGEVSTLNLEAGFLEAYLGGKGFAASILYQETGKGLNPLSPESLVVLAVGPLTGTAAPGANRLAACFKSPLTGIWGESYCGGELGTQLKWAGIDVLTITGRSPKPVYLLVDDGRVEIRDAGYLWGKDSFEAEKALIGEVGRDFQAAVIGPAGENLVKFACVTHSRGRQFGRCGLGAVFGSKNLKALAFHGSQMPEVANVEALAAFRERISEAVREKLGSLSNYGTPAISTLLNKVGALPTRNWREGSYEKFEEVSPEILKGFYKRRRACYGCPVACRHLTDLGGGFWVEGPE
ncbi:aldehyde ferredoxin oxidoreductase, partial [Candidatus Bathyarchaeota archaeon]